MNLSLDFKISYYASVEWFEAQWIKLNKVFQILSVKVMSVQEHSSEGQIYVCNNKLFFPLWLEVFSIVTVKIKMPGKKSCLAWKFGALETRGLISRVSFILKNVTCPHIVYMKCMNSFFLHPLLPWVGRRRWEGQV